MSKTENLNINISKSRKRSLGQLAREDRFTMTRVVENLIDDEIDRRARVRELQVAEEKDTGET